MSATSSFSLNTDDQNFLFTFESSDGSTFAVPRDGQTHDGVELSDQAVKGLTALKSNSAQQNYLSRFLGRLPIPGTGQIKLSTAAIELRKKNDSKDFDQPTVYINKAVFQ